MILLGKVDPGFRYADIVGGGIEYGSTAGEVAAPLGLSRNRVAKGLTCLQFASPHIR